MHIAGHPYEVLTTAEIELIHHSALRILNEMGMEIQNEELLKVLADFGLQVDFQEDRVRFPGKIVERFLSEVEKYDWENHVPRVGGSAGLYHGLFHDPASGKLLPWTEERMAYYFALARKLEHIDGASMLGSRIPGPPNLEPLYERYYCWKYGASEGRSIYLDELCPYLYELYQIRADSEGVPIQEVFSGTVYLVPPMKLGRHEAYQVQYFRERGLRVGIGDMFSLGGTAPVTYAAAVTLNWAENLALHILEWAWFGIKRLHLGTSIAAMDMKTMIYPFGRPAMAISAVISAQIARHFGASFSGHGGLSDSKLPSVESGAQKAYTAVPTLMAGGSFWMDAGLLSIDEVYSPIQMILDNEFLSALKHFTRSFEVSETSIGLDTIFEAGPGGGYLDKMHTARYFRTELWQPEIWSRTMLGPWQAAGSKLDVDLARDIALDVQKNSKEYQGLDSDFESQILKLIEKANRELGTN
jgi:trimethylamine--corrinoid protein Co-methyltransferase